MWKVTSCKEARIGHEKGMPAPSPNQIILTPAEVAAWRDELEAEGQKLVFTNGCFDLVHPGHTRYLSQARELGDALVVALNSDASVRALKGPTRPVTEERDRAEVLRALRSVDAVVVFDDERATALIDEIRPHIYCKGGDYTEESLNAEERAAIARVGARVRILPLVAGKSTTNTLKRLNAELTGTGKLRLGVLGSGAGTNLQALVAAIKAGELYAEIACVLTDVRNCGFHQCAKSNNLAVHHVDAGPNPTRFPDHAQKEVFEHLQRAEVDVVVLAGFLRVLREPVLSAFSGRIVNLHPSLLPKFPGSNAVQRALDEGELETGTTLHLVTGQLDAGPILAQKKVPIRIGDTAESLHARIKQEEHILLVQVLNKWQGPTAKGEGRAPAQL